MGYGDSGTRSGARAGHPTSVQLPVRRFRKSNEKLAVQARARGCSELGQWVRRTDEGAPPDAALCPNHPDIATRWRGPLATSSTHPMVKIKSRGGMVYDAVACIGEHESREHAAVRLYAIADIYADKPCGMGEHHLIWQASPCLECMEGRMQNWLDEIWPPPPQKAKRGGQRDEGGDWDL